MLEIFRKAPLEIIRVPLASREMSESPVELWVDRATLAKRRWRAAAPDGTEFGFDLREPLSDGRAFFESETRAYVVRQLPESLLSGQFSNASQAAQLGWEIGNMHLPIMIRGEEFFVEDDPAIRQILRRLNISFDVVEAVFQPLSGAAQHHF